MGRGFQLVNGPQMTGSILELGSGSGISTFFIDLLPLFSSGFGFGFGLGWAGIMIS